MSQAFNEKSVFLEALRLPADERESFLRAACPDEAARRRIQTLLKHHAEAGSLFVVAADPDSAALSLPDQIDEFKILSRLGEGGMGVVYLAQDTILGRKVALKLLAPHLAGSEQALGRFQDEAKTAAALRHPVIVPVYKFGSSGGITYIASEYVEGSTLGALVKQERERRTQAGKKEGERDWQRRSAEIIATIADALDNLHRARIVHRDIKPSNILIDREQGPRLADFGIAKNLNQEPRAEHTLMMGSAHYMSPEQASVASSKIDGRSDLFSLGVVLFEMLSLERPFDGRDVSQVLTAVIRAEPRPLRKLDRSIARDLETICAKAMRKDPGDRYPTAAHMAADLRCFLDGRPILARPPSLAAKAVWKAKRHRGPLAATAILLLALGLSLALLSLKTQRDAKLAWISVDAGAIPCRLYLQDHDARTLRPLAPRPLGSAPLRSLGLAPGHYRLTAVRTSDQAFVEFNLPLAEPGRDHARKLKIVNDPEQAAAGPAEVVAVMRPTAEVRADGMIQIEAGSFNLRRPANSDPILAGPVTLEAFSVDRTQVSNREYKAFVDSTGHAPPVSWNYSPYSEETADLPVLWVRFDDAEAYARWRGKRLPTLAEWQAAARGPEGRLYPSGDTRPQVTGYTPGDLELSSPEAIMASYRKAATPAAAPDPWDPPLGMIHTFSNVHEYTATLDKAGRSAYSVGRAWYLSPVEWNLSRLMTTSLGAPSPSAGFRCAKSARPPSEASP